MSLDRHKIGLGVAGLLIGCAGLFTSIRFSVPRSVEVRLHGTPYVTVEIKGLDDLRPLPRTITIQLPDGFQLDVPTQYRGTVDGEVVVKEKRP